MYKIFSDTRLFIVSYLLLVLPTYLADAGLVQNGLSLNTFNMTSLLYVLCMVGIWGLCLVRGAMIGKNWLVFIPTVAFIFDLTPALAVISAVPYIYHALAIFLGAVSPSVTTNVDTYV
ncbi:hypothetical protein [Methylophilus sp. Leaf414]|uniref:hypothetical protein n=1 Tax=Methylophilus sp. Leaf414 TaxID=1736371 RepID=UPI0006F88495|nr:hypothetical protein [Methylophilus sp. Leaf414]KQT36035.1 hypothetical protein ASG24_07080 [Methylophilus sp. Leaf414]